MFQLLQGNVGCTDQNLWWLQNNVIKRVLFFEFYGQHLVKYRHFLKLNIQFCIKSQFQLPKQNVSHRNSTLVLVWKYKCHLSVTVDQEKKSYKTRNSFMLIHIFKVGYQCCLSLSTDYHCFVSLVFINYLKQKQK